MTSTSPDRYAVFGNPVEHSKSPLIHRQFAVQTGQTLDYSRKCIEPDQFDIEVRNFFYEGGKGLNITVPFKLDAFRLADQLTPRAELAGAVNTLKALPDGKLLGDNTDGVGLVRDLTKNLQWVINNKRILVLGAGGAVRGILSPLLEQKPREIIIANRTFAKASELCHVLLDERLSACSFDQLPAEPFDIIINGTSASLAGELPPLPATILAPHTACYDMMYGKQLSPFLLWAQQHGATKLADGLGMLVEEAAESFFLWREQHPDTAPVINLVRQQL